MTAFAGESQANRKYLAFAKRAEKDGYPNIARLFRAVAEAETVHAHNHLRVAGGVQSTVENLTGAMEGEHYEIETMYPEFIKTAQDEAAKQAERTFDWAYKTEKIHRGMYKEALETVKSGKDIAVNDYYVCEVCGYTAEGEAPERCPICGAIHAKFFKVE